MIFDSIVAEVRAHSVAIFEECSKELALKLEEKGYDWVKDEVLATA